MSSVPPCGTSLWGRTVAQEGESRDESCGEQEGTSASKRGAVGAARSPGARSVGVSPQIMLFSRKEEPPAIKVVEGLGPLAAHLPDAEEPQENPPLQNEGECGS